MAKRIAKRVSRAATYRVGNVNKTAYDMGWDLWYTGNPLPLDAPRNMQQGYVNASKAQDKCLVQSMRCAARKGLFTFLPQHEALIGPNSEKPASWGHTGRYMVRRARAMQAQVKAAGFDCR